MKFMKRVCGKLHKFHIKMTTSVRFCLSYDRFKLEFIAFKVDIISIENNVVRDVFMRYTYVPKCYLTWSYNIYYMTLSTE